MFKPIISELWIYPVKSLGGLRLNHCNVLKKGIDNDRRWMLIDNNNNFLTQRVYPRLSLFRISLGAGGFLISFEQEIILLPSGTIGNKIMASIWDDKVEVVEVDPAISKWFTSKLGIDCRLVFLPEGSPRPVDPRYAPADQHVSLADAYPLLVIGQPSLDDLNRRMNIPLPMNRFRPNIVFTGGKAYDEDRWNDFRIGNCKLRAVKPCARCVLTTVDQETGLKGTEPLVTLSSYRRVGNKVLFGQNLIVIEEGGIEIGNEIIFY